MSVTAVPVSPPGAFYWQGCIYPYFSDGYNSTRVNERAVEVSIAMNLVNQAARVIEVGAVLPHYIPGWPDCGHEVIDLHEEFPFVTNADVLTHEPDGFCDLVICISTLDHLLDAQQVKTAVRRMKSWLTTGGKLFATLPANQPADVGGGPWLDKLIFSGELDMNITRMDKINPQRHIWQETAVSAPSLPYGSPTPFANTIYLMEWQR